MWPHWILTELPSRSKVGLWQTGPKLAIAGWVGSFSRMRDVKFRLSSCVKKNRVELRFPTAKQRLSYQLNRSEFILYIFHKDY